MALLGVAWGAGGPRARHPVLAAESVRPKAGFEKAERRDTQAGLLLSFHAGGEPGFSAAALPSRVLPLFPTLQEVYSISPGCFSHFFPPSFQTSPR